jgi:hypothetical protein
MIVTVTYDTITDYYCIYPSNARLENRRNYHFNATMQVDEFTGLLAKTSNLTCQFWQDIHNNGVAKLSVDGTKFRKLVRFINTLSPCARNRSLYLLLRSAYDVLHNAPYMASYK